MSGAQCIDWVPTAVWPGQLGLTLVPGEQGAGEVQPGVVPPGVVHRRDMAADLRALAQAGTNVIAPLIEPFEFGLPGMEGYHEHAEANRLSVVSCPVPDLGVPRDPAAFASFVDSVMDALLDGQHVALHCRGDLGRAGLVTACLLVMGSGDAVTLVGRTWPGAAPSTRQEAFIRTFEYHYL